MAIQTVIGAFDNRQSAESAVERLVSAGVDRGNVHIEPAASMSSDTSTTTGTTMTAGTVHDEDRGVMASIGHFFASLFGEDDDNRRHVGRYSEAVRRGHVVVAVDAATEQQAEQASTLLHECGAVDVDERAEQWRTQGWDESAATNQYLGTTDTTRDMGDTRGTRADLTGQQKLDVVQEELQIGKRQVEKGGVRVIQRVSEKPVRELVRLREERAIVDRQPVNREATAADLSNFREGSIELRETVEEPVVQKTARVVEEVRVGKDVREREQTIEDTVRRKDVEVERLPGEGMSRTEIERERAVAADDTTDIGTTRDRDSLVERDRDTLGDRVTLSERGTTGTTGKKPRKNL